MTEIKQVDKALDELARRILIWLGGCRDLLPPEAITSMQDIADTLQTESGLPAGGGDLLWRLHRTKQGSCQDVSQAALINPDGPEAAAHIRTLEARVGELEGVAFRKRRCPHCAGEFQLIAHVDAHLKALENDDAQ